MKKLFLLFLVGIFCLSSLTACVKEESGGEDPSKEECVHTWSRQGYADMHSILEVCLECEATQTYPDPDIATMDEATTVKLLQYAWDRHGLSHKVIEGEVAVDLIATIRELAFTGKTVDALSDQPLPEFGPIEGVEPGTQWLEIGNCIFRATSGFEQICRVETHLGKGYVLNADESLQTALKETTSYYPYDYYSAICRYGNITKFEHVYSAPSTIGVDGLEVSFPTKSDKATHNRITLYLTSSIDQTIEVSMFQQGGCVVGVGASTTVTFEKGVSQKVDLLFDKEGFDKDIAPLRITADKTRISIAVK